MDLSAIGEAVLLAREGRRNKAYRDSVGVWTVGAGVTSASGLIKVTPGLVLTAAEVDALNRRAFALYAGYVDRALHGVIVPQHTYDALVSLCYNIGPGRFAGSTFLRKLKAGDMEGARAAVLLWSKPAAIVPRRQAESDQLVTPYAKRLPERVRGAGPVRVAIGQGASPAPTPRAPRPAIAARRPVAPSVVTPAWLLALGRLVDLLFAPRLPAH